ncbi:MAG TPA: plastocyanin/azurin family copper-binding protein [Acidimicrobiales bacterium]|nr:plastocyanin/azurin family copper-binding protein [Acidimicrobiales bacterium]
MTKRNAAKWIVPAGLALSLAFMGACGGDSGSDEQTSSTATTMKTEAQAAATVEITEFAFAPKEVRVSVGDTVRWINRDEFLHTVTSGAVDGPENKPDDKFDEDLAEAGSEATITFDEAGTFTYFCKQHNAMDGVVIVE